MQIYVVIEDIDDYPEDGGGTYPDALFLNYANAEKYAKRKNKERFNNRYNYYVEAWKTVDEKENENG